MEIVGVVVQLMECMSPSISQRWKDHRDVYRSMDTLKQRLEDLNCRRNDIKSTLDKESEEGEIELRSEVETWLRRVEMINEEVNDIEVKVRNAKFFSRASLAKNVTQKMVEVEELREKGTFPEGLALSITKRGDFLPTTTTLGGETTFQRKVEEIWATLFDDKVAKIGVCGMGGIGKTTALEQINNRLLKEQKDKFDSVIWVTVSKDSSVWNLQDTIARKLGLDVSNDNDQKTRAAKLYARLGTRKRYVLILDDLWEPYSLEDVGIREPTPQNGCKLIVTTRVLDVCRGMDCKAIQMELLLEEEALSLFQSIVGCNVMSDQNLEVILKELVRECARLPLAVVTIAASLKGNARLDEWEIALEDLRECTKGSKSDGIFERLKYSYDRLNDKRLQDCLLYCALYSEDYPIDRNYVTEQLVVEGIIVERETRQSQIRRGRVILDKLVDVCLLHDTIDSKGNKCVKMHDMVRDMALQITSESPRFLVKAGVGLKSIPEEEFWKVDLVRASLNDNHIRDIPSSIEAPNCPNLLTFLMSRNPFLSSIPDHFFLNMKKLSVLDLSNNKSLQNLPDSVSDLVSLTALFLRYCQRCKYVPSLAKLTNLRKLDLKASAINQVPQGMEMLLELRYMDFGDTNIKIIPGGILFKLTNLQYLSLNGGWKIGPEVRGWELENMRKLETFEGVFYDVKSFNTCVRSLEHSRAASYKLQLGTGLRSPKKFRSDKSVFLLNYDILERVAADGECQLLLPKDVEVLLIQVCAISVRNLCELTSFKNVTKLSKCIIRSSCAQMEHVFSYSPCIFPLLQSLKELVLIELPNLRGLIRRERGASMSPFPSGTFSSLIHLKICECDKIKKLFMVDSLPNLEELYLERCKQLKEIISTSSDDDDGDEGECDDHGVNILTLPKLRELRLSRLPQLESIPIVADSLQGILIEVCPKLKRLSILDREPCPSLQRVSIRKVKWESLKWDHLNAKDFVQALRTSAR